MSNPFSRCRLSTVCGRLLKRTRLLLKWISLQCWWCPHAMYILISIHCLNRVSGARGYCSFSANKIHSAIVFYVFASWNTLDDVTYTTMDSVTIHLILFSDAWTQIGKYISFSISVVFAQTECTSKQWKRMYVVHWKPLHSRSEKELFLGNRSLERRKKRQLSSNNNKTADNEIASRNLFPQKR